MKKRHAFTLIELIIVVIVIGILATLAVPQFLKATERAKIAKAKNALGLLAKAEKLYRAEKDTYVVTAVNGANTVLGSYMELQDVDADQDWSYAVGGVSASGFTATATRLGSGSIVGCTITLNQTSTMVDGCTTKL